MQAVPGGANYWDLGLLEGHARLSYFAFDENGEGEEVVVNLPLPEETMDELEELVGDGNATLTVGKDLKVSEDYKTAGSSCFLKLTCNQDLETVLKTREIGTTLALAFAEQGFEQAQYVMDKMCGRDVQPPPPLEVTSSTSKKKKAAKAKSKDVDPEPNRKQTPKAGTKRPVLKNKPSFRR